MNGYTYEVLGFNTDDTVKIEKTFNNKFKAISFYESLMEDNLPRLQLVKLKNGIRIDTIRESWKI